MADVQDRLRAEVEAFVTELTELVQQAVLDEVAASLASEGHAAPQTDLPLDGRSKRSAREIEAQCATIVAYVTRHPGQRAEAIAAALGTSAKGLTLALKKLMATHQITREGQKRASRYFAAPNGTRQGGR